jgi:hypothetical protein
MQKSMALSYMPDGRMDRSIHKQAVAQTIRLFLKSMWFSTRCKLAQCKNSGY